MLSFYSRILVAYDGSEMSEKALDIATDLANKNSKVEVGVVVVSHSPSLASMGSYGVYSQELIKEVQDNDRSLLNHAKEKLDQLTNKTRSDLLDGNPGKMIVEFARQKDFDLVLLGSRGLSGLKEVFLGSVSHYVVQRAHCPVFVVK